MTSAIISSFFDSSLNFLVPLPNVVSTYALPLTFYMKLVENLSLATSLRRINPHLRRSWARHSPQTRSFTARPGPLITFLPPPPYAHLAPGTESFLCEIVRMKNEPVPETTNGPRRTDPVYPPPKAFPVIGDHLPLWVWMMWKF